MEAGARLGRIDGLGSFRFGYTGQDLDRDAVMTAFNGDDWYLHSWYRGHLVRAGVGLGRGFAVQGTCVKDAASRDGLRHDAMDDRSGETLLARAAITSFENKDGVITRGEWRGNDQSFRQHDKNGDGILSGVELRTGKKKM